MMSQTVEQTRIPHILTQVVPLEMREVPSEEAVCEALKRRKRALMDNPGKTLHDLLPFLPKERCDDSEAYAREHWDEIVLD